MLTYHTRRRRIAGQGMTEYIIVVALIAVAAIGVYSAFGDVVRGQTSVAAVALSGRDASSGELCFAATHEAVGPRSVFTKLSQRRSYPVGSQRARERFALPLSRVTFELTGVPSLRACRCHKPRSASALARLVRTF